MLCFRRKGKDKKKERKTNDGRKTNSKQTRQIRKEETKDKKEEERSETSPFWRFTKKRKRMTN